MRYSSFSQAERPLVSNSQHPQIHPHGTIEVVNYVGDASVDHAEKIEQLSGFLKRIDREASKKKCIKRAAKVAAFMLSFSAAAWELYKGLNQVYLSKALDNQWKEEKTDCDTNKTCQAIYSDLYDYLGGLSIASQLSRIFRCEDGSVDTSCLEIPRGYDDLWLKNTFIFLVFFSLAGASICYYSTCVAGPIKEFSMLSSSLKEDICNFNQNQQNPIDNLEQMSLANLKITLSDIKSELAAELCDRSENNVQSGWENSP